MQVSEIDVSDLIGESYRIDGIIVGECRSIFLDWALKLPAAFDQAAAIALLVETYADRAPDHPMSSVLREALVPAAPAGRRGGYRRRRD